jgi:exopolyphosphatase/guanosine-5'-triphosphate,3'-diphosphate pyrophosphatase
MRVAAIDIGTNSALLLIAEARGGELVPVLERSQITRLGEGVDATRALAPEAVRRTLTCLEEYGAEIRAAGVDRIAAVGTSAMRDAAGGEDFRTRARAILGAEPQVISGAEEAALTFTGAITGLSLPDGIFTVFDLGGGSTEIICGARGGALTAVSLDIGSVRLTERHVRSDPPAPEELAAIRADAAQALAGALSQQAPLSGALSQQAPLSGPLVGVAGTVTTLTAFARAVFPYDSARIHDARLTAAEVTRIRAELAGMPLARRRALPAINPARADVIVAGAVIVEELLAWAKADELIVSDRGVRWGLAYRLVNGSTRAI